MLSVHKTITHHNIITDRQVLSRITSTWEVLLTRLVLCVVLVDLTRHRVEGVLWETTVYFSEKSDGKQHCSNIETSCFNNTHDPALIVTNPQRVIIWIYSSPQLQAAVQLGLLLSSCLAVISLFLSRAGRDQKQSYNTNCTEIQVITRQRHVPTVPKEVSYCRLNVCKAGTW